MVFLRPVVVRDGQASSALSMDRYDQMRTQQQQAQPVNSTMVPVNEAPVLPALLPSGAVAPVPLTVPLATPAPRGYQFDSAPAADLRH